MLLQHAAGAFLLDVKNTQYGKIGVSQDPTTMSMYHMKPWAPALTLLEEFGQMPLPKQSQVLLPAPGCHALRLRVNLHEVFSGKCTTWRWLL